jgi:peptidoglycan/LPS O-acetylase OafA/YrhL
MGYQPGLDGLRAISVTAVVLYHAGFTWIHGGFFGVEVFFVVSGFLITSLLIEERENTNRVSLPQFWMRRVRRLIPALVSVLLAVSVWAALFGSAEQTSQMRRDLPWAIPYAANWGQIAGDVPYFQPGDPPLLRHLWSLAVEEQWYLFWPLAFVGLAATRLRRDHIAKLLVGIVALLFVLTWWIQRGGDTPMSLPGVFDGANRVNFLYLSTITRASGLLLGAAAAFVWRPWRSQNAHRAPARALDLAMGVSLGLLVCCFLGARLTAGYMYPWLLFFVSIVSVVAVAVVVHPAAVGSRLVLSWPPLVELGKRSYGLYLWHWPIFVILKATHGSAGRFLAAIAIAAVVTELSYRFIETPVRKGALARWWADRPKLAAQWAPVGGLAAMVLALVVFYVTVEPFDAAAGGADVEFELGTNAPAPSDSANTGSDPTVTVASTPVTGGSTVDSGDPPEIVADTSTATTLATAGPPTTPPVLPRTVAIVGDSQAHALAINLPSGIESTFTIEDGSIDGCSIYDRGNVVSSRDGFRNTFGICEGWVGDWADAAQGNDVALVVLGAWDVFDLEIDGQTYVFGSAEFDALFTTNLTAGIQAMLDVGAQVALLEVACMRPQDVEGAGVPALPERGDDARVAHLNDLMRGIAAAHTGQVTFVEGPDAWCNDPAISADLAYRWDGVHVYKPGANLIYETIAPALLAIPVTRTG